MADNHASVFKGWLNKETGQSVLKKVNWKKRWVVLHGSTLQFFKDPKEAKPKTTIDVTKYTSIRKTKIKSKDAATAATYCIELTSKSNKDVKSLLLSAENQFDTRIWATLLKGLMHDTQIDVTSADKQGPLHLLGGKSLNKSWKERFGILQFYTLYIFKSASDLTAPILSIDLSLCTNTKQLKAKDQPYSFSVTTGGGGATGGATGGDDRDGEEDGDGVAHFFATGSELEMRDWLDAIQSLQRAYNGHGAKLDGVQLKQHDQYGLRHSSSAASIQLKEKPKGESDTVLELEADTTLRFPSPTRPDSRIMGLAEGRFITTWKELIIGHNSDGNEIWRIPGWGKAVCVNPEKNMIAASNKKKEWAIFKAQTGEITIGPIQHTDWLYCLCWLSSGKFIAASSLTQIYLFSASDGKMTNAWTKRFPDGELVSPSTMANAAKQDLAMPPTTEPEKRNDGYLMRIHSIVALRGDLVAASEPSIDSVWVADLQRGIILNNMAFTSPYDLDMMKEDKTEYISVDGANHVGVITIYRHHKSTDSSKKDFDVLEFSLPGRLGVKIAGTEELIRFKPMAHISPSRNNLLVTDKSARLWVISLTSDIEPRFIPPHILSFVHDFLWLDDNAFLAISNDRTLYKVDLQLNAVVFSRTVF